MMQCLSSPSIFARTLRGLSQGASYPSAFVRGFCSSMSVHQSESGGELAVPVDVRKQNHAHYITFNRPKSLNALDLEMIKTLTPQLVTVNSDEDTGVVIMQGHGGKAFCAGGDIRTLWDHRDQKEGTQVQEEFFRNEYRLDHMLARSSSFKPYVCLYNGIVMGGGVGVSINAPVRLATESTVFAMPETGIGFFPDVGGSYFLPRLRGGLGMYLALTGHRLKGYDAVAAGVATHYVKPDKVDELLKALEQVGPSHSDNIDSIVDRYADQTAMATAAKSDIVRARSLIDHAFTKGSVEAIMAELNEMKQSDDEFTAEWATKTIKTLNKMSPTSLKVTHEQLERGKNLTLDECYKMELALATNFMRDNDFYEGVRATLVEKDSEPKWIPSTLHEVEKEKVQSYFELPEEVAPLELESPTNLVQMGDLFGSNVDRA
eukprot:gb/GECG01010864.1/.p1 GENE.gb/GECG01010864.1/~~gb/GECG01010864.1/.p1  ORF type:complete len:432 (+),score=57.90 gb/GECG01010864.1/:1-1296(+)